MTTILNVPGLGGSGPEHWQSYWERGALGAVRVEQDAWDAPIRADWCARLEDAVLRVDGLVVLAAHSLGVIVVAHWVATASRKALGQIKGALLVAPPDVESSDRVPAVLRPFAPIPRAPLPFASIVVGSRNDSYACIDCPRELARAWGARFVDVGECGHINADSQLGDWPEGRALLAELV
jgi:predicted alpha/beta hydrolase family esterase